MVDIGNRFRIPAGMIHFWYRPSNVIAIEISSFGPPEVLKPVERPKPVPKDDEVVIRVEAAGVARADLMQRQGKYPPPPGASDIPGLDVAGVIDSIGSNVHEWKVGDRVCAILTGGGYAEFCAAPAVQVSTHSEHLECHRRRHTPGKHVYRLRQPNYPCWPQAR